MRAELNIIRKDWSDYRNTVLLFTFGLLAVLLMKLGDLGKGMATGLVFSACYAFAQFCFVMERQRETLDLLLGLPIRPRNVILAKYGSVYSMTLLLINVPGLFLGDFRVVLFANAAALTLSTIFMTPPVLSENEWAPTLPLCLSFFMMLPAENRQALTHAFTLHAMPITVAALLLSPAVAFLAAVVFERKSIR